MKKIKLIDVNEYMVKKHEELFIEKVVKVIHTYKEKFRSHGLDLCYHTFWQNTSKHKVFDCRIPLEHGYRSCIIIEVRKNGKNVLLDDDEKGQVFVISSIVSIVKQVFAKCHVIFVDETDEIVEDLEECYQQVKEYGVIEWDDKSFIK